MTDKREVVKKMIAKMLDNRYHPIESDTEDIIPRDIKTNEKGEAKRWSMPNYEGERFVKAAVEVDKRAYTAAVLMGLFDISPEEIEEELEENDG